MNSYTLARDGGQVPSGPLTVLLCEWGVSLSLRMGSITVLMFIPRGHENAWATARSGCPQIHCPWLSLVDGPKPQRPRMPCRNRSRSSGVMCCQRSAMRRRKLERWKPWRPNPPKRIRHSARIPSACQKVIWRQPKSDGSSQFQSCSTISPPMAINTKIPTIASGAM